MKNPLKHLRVVETDALEKGEVALISNPVETKYRLPNDPPEFEIKIEEENGIVKFKLVERKRSRFSWLDFVKLAGIKTNEV